MSAVSRVRCPTCCQPVDWVPENPYRPFCSQRCRLIDLGTWADESNRLPVWEDDEQSETVWQETGQQF